MPRTFRSALPLLFVVTPFVLAHCGTRAGGDGAFPDDPDGGGATAGSTGVTGGTTLGDPSFGGCDAGLDCGTTGGKPAPVCGDGVLGAGEGCDDSNTQPGDGCGATCQVESGWSCPVVGLRCEAAACGDGIVAGNEECDFAGGTPPAGCSSSCRIAAGYDCNTTTLTCAKVVCGDKAIGRGETCDDGAGDLPFDGCYKCQKEPSCTNGVCVASCGDGQRFASEACDDGNTRSGDGCSADCKVETGFKCTDVTAAPPPSIDLPVVVRDFIGKDNQDGGATYHEDFNRHVGNGISGIVESTLGADGRPVYVCPDPDPGGDPTKGCTQNPGHLFIDTTYNRPNTSTKANFDQWFRNVPAVNMTSFTTVTLKRDAATGTYKWDSSVAADNGGKTFFDPIHDGGWVGAGKEKFPSDSSCNDRNVSFTSETHFWFEYQGGEKFTFSGDDDTWVFVNGKLVIDLGGLHGRKDGSFTLDGDTDAAGPDKADGKAAVTRSSPYTPASQTIDLGLVPGGVYELVMFQAERNQCGSNFGVTLKDFNRPKSVCASECGDGVVASDELCDDGKNDGSYGHCAPGCKARGPRCGDGVVQPDFEKCDDGNTDPTDACSNACQPPDVR